MGWLCRTAVFIENVPSTFRLFQSAYGIFIERRLVFHLCPWGAVLVNVAVLPGGFCAVGRSEADRIGRYRADTQYYFTSENYCCRVDMFDRNPQQVQSQVSYGCIGLTACLHACRHCLKYYYGNKKAR